ncbi:hypothetical protein EPUL_006525, partial [Erysiphe pulchra]
SNSSWTKKNKKSKRDQSPSKKRSNDTSDPQAQDKQEQIDQNRLKQIADSKAKLDALNMAEEEQRRNSENNQDAMSGSNTNIFNKHDYMTHAIVEPNLAPNSDNTMGAYMDCRQVNLELSQWNLKDIIVDYESLGNALRPFVLSGSKVHRLVPEDLNVYANTSGIYENKEITKIIKINGLEVPTTMMGLMANGTKFFDAWIWLSMNPNLRPAPIKLPYTNKPDEKVELSTYDDMGMLTTYIFIAYFFILIRAHPPTQLDAYHKQPMPKFISTILGTTATAVEVAMYLASFELIKLNNEWVKQIKPLTLNVEAANRLGLGVAGYRLVSVFNLILPTKYYSDDPKVNEALKETRPPWLEVSLKVMQSFKNAGPCWDFHPATRDPNLISKYGNINKNATNMILDCYTAETIKLLLDGKKLSVEPQPQL